MGTDHAGYDLKQHLVTVLRADGHDVVDHGAQALDPSDDYPPYCFAAAEAVRADPQSLGVVLGGSGNGEQLAANRVPGIRAALAWNDDVARLARAHNDARVVAVGARQHSLDEATAIVRAFLAEPFSGDARHQRRIDMLDAYPASAPVPAAGSTAGSTAGSVGA